MATVGVYLRVDEDRIDEVRAGLAAIEGASNAADGPYAHDGARLGRGLALYHRGDFEEEKNNAFMVFDDSAIESRVDGETHRMVLNGAVEYTSPRFTATLDKDTFKLLEATPTAATDGEALSLEAAADMFILLKGMQGSMNHLPAMAADGSRGTFVTHPGYQD